MQNIISIASSAVLFQLFQNHSVQDFLEFLQQASTIKFLDCAGRVVCDISVMNKVRDLITRSIVCCTEIGLFINISGANTSTLTLRKGNAVDRYIANDCFRSAKRKGLRT